MKIHNYNITPPLLVTECFLDVRGPLVEVYGKVLLHGFDPRPEYENCFIQYFTSIK